MVSVTAVDSDEIKFVLSLQHFPAVTAGKHHTAVPWSLMLFDSLLTRSTAGAGKSGCRNDSK
jgi:hypothetical protein